MKYVLLGAFNNYLNVFMPLQCVNEMTDDDIKESHRRAVLQGKVPEHPEHIIVFKFGTFEDSTGEAIILDKPVKICALAEFLPRKVNTEVQENVNEARISS